MILAQFSSSPTAFLSSLGSELPFGAAAAPTVEKSRAPEKPQKRGASRATLVVWIGMGGRSDHDRHRIQRSNKVSVVNQEYFARHYRFGWSGRVR